MIVKERILQYLDYKNISITRAEIDLGWSKSSLLKSNNISTDKASEFVHFYNDISPEWLLTGEGEMLKGEGGKETVAISPNDIKENVYTGTPVYDIDGTCGQQDRDIHFTEDNIIGSIDLPEISKSSKIIRANGDSMEPVIHDGNRIVIREILSRSDIFYGQIYLVITEEYRMIKYLRRYEPDEENYVILRSENPKYDDIRLHKGKIIKMFVVENILSVKTQM